MRAPTLTTQAAQSQPTYSKMWGIGALASWSNVVTNYSNYATFLWSFFKNWIIRSNCTICDNTILKEVWQHEGHHGRESKVGKEDDSKRQDDGYRHHLQYIIIFQFHFHDFFHHLLRVYHLLPHGSDHVEANKPVEGARGAVYDSVNSKREKTSIPAPTVAFWLVIAQVLNIRNSRLDLIQSTFIARDRLSIQDTSDAVSASAINKESKNSLISKCSTET